MFDPKIDEGPKNKSAVIQEKDVSVFCTSTRLGEQQREEKSLKIITCSVPLSTVLITTSYPGPLLSPASRSNKDSGYEVLLIQWTSLRFRLNGVGSK